MRKEEQMADNNYDPFKVQVGGNHYAKYVIQPTEYIQKNNMSWCEGNVVKYITRWKDKNGIADLRKAKHYIELLISLEEQKVETQKEQLSKMSYPMTYTYDINIQSEVQSPKDND
jgi:hypothetical protein